MARRTKSAKAKAEGKRPRARKTPTPAAARVRDLETRLAESLKREAEALERLQARDHEVLEGRERETATAEILHVMSQSQPDLQSVLNAVAARAARLCDSIDAQIFRIDGTVLRLAASYGSVPKTTSEEPRPISRGTVNGRAVVDRRTIHLHDLAAESDLEFPEGKSFQRRFGHRTILATPLLREGAPIGAITIRRMEVRPFSDAQIRLLETFSHQAVIAIENVRLFTELQDKNKALTQAHAQVTESLEQQTATSEVLKVIASTPTDLTPVFDAILRSAVTLFNAYGGSIRRFDGELVYLAAVTSPNPEADDRLRRMYPHRPDREHRADRPILDGMVVHIADTDEEPSESTRRLARDFGYRRLLGVPMLREGQIIGSITVAGSEPGPYSARQIALLRTFADQAVIAIENVRLFTELQEKNHALTKAHSQVTEALERQTATADILRVISSSPTDIQPVFDIIGERAEQLCDAAISMVSRFDGEQIHLVALHGVMGPAAKVNWEAFPQRPDDDTLSARAVRSRAVAHVADVLTDPLYAQKGAARASGQRASLAVPMIRDNQVIGVIFVARTRPGLFTDNHVELLKTFADQAVIAIENVRLFKELEARNRDLTATAEILRVIASSPTDLQPVFDTIADRSMRLCEATFGWVVMFDGALMHLRSLANVSPEGADALRHMFPLAPSRASAAGRAILTADVVHMPDVLDDPEYEYKSISHATHSRGVLTVPLLRQGRPIGAITVIRPEPGTFSGELILLLKTFADQAVIAIENARLFNETKEALEQQTATSEILRVMSSSPTDVQPVFDVIVERAVRLCGARFGRVYRYDGDVIHMVAGYGLGAAGLGEVQRVFPRPASDDTIVGRVILTRQPALIRDIEHEEGVPALSRRMIEALETRSQVTIPMLRTGQPIGAITLGWAEPEAFDEQQIALLRTFADQAVIAIENVRLFKELEARTHDLTRSVGELRALGEVGQAISSTLDLRTVLSTIVARATQLSGTDAGVIYEYDESREVFVPRATEHLEDEIVETMLATPVRKGEGATGRLAEAQEPIQVPDILAAPAESRVRGALVRAGYRALLAVPLVREDHLLGGLTVIRKATGLFAPEVVELLRTFATQSTLAIQNARLFLEIEDKSRQLEAASRHKSEFLANMSHELRTPLNAIIGFSEVLMQRMFGELNAKQEEYLKDIYESGRHLLSLINDILDLSKIEAGRMELELTDFDLPTAIDSALTLVRERATRRGIALQKTLDTRVGPIQADERKVRQVVLNLLSNAIKFTPEGGRIEVRAMPVDGSVEVSVTDTGVGIAPEDQEAVFEEFRQVGSSAAKQEGTGLGLALCRRFVELHGGTIRVTSAVGAGSTFTFRLPVRP